MPSDTPLPVKAGGGGGEERVTRIPKADMWLNQHPFPEREKFNVICQTAASAAAAPSAAAAATSVNVQQQ